MNTSDEEVHLSNEIPRANITLFTGGSTTSKLNEVDTSNRNCPTRYVQDLKLTSYWETLTHMLKGNIGCGLLATGSAFKSGGLVFSSILVILLGFIASYNQYLLVTMANKFKQKHNLSTINFADTVSLAFECGPPIFRKMSKFIRYAIKLFLVLTQLGFCCVYFLFLSQSLEQICICYNIHINIHILMLIVLPVIWSTALIRELKYVAPLSAFANLSIFIALALILYNSTFDLTPLSERRFIGEWRQIPLCFGVIIYSLEGIGLVLPLQQNMKNKEKFLGTCGVLNLSLTFVVTLIVTIGFFGYWKYGDEVKESLTLNLEANHNVLTQAVIICMTIGILCTYALQFFIAVLLLLPYSNNWLNSKFSFGNEINEYLLRSFLVIGTFLTAEIIPHLDLFVSLIGAIGGTFLALIFPPLADISRRYTHDKGVMKWRTVLAMVSLIIGVIGFMIGTVTSVKEILNAIAHDLKLDGSTSG